MLRHQFIQCTSGPVFRSLLWLLVLVFIVQSILTFQVLPYAATDSGVRDPKTLGPSLQALTTLMAQRPHLPEHHPSTSSWVIDDNHVYVRQSNSPTCTPIIANKISTYLTTTLKQSKYGVCYSVRAQTGWLTVDIIPEEGIYSWSRNLSLINFILTLLLLLYIWTVLKLILPLYLFQASAKQLGLHFKYQPMIGKGLAIIQNTSTTLDFMQKKLLSALTLRTRTLASISHDLRMPIARMMTRERDDASSKTLKDLQELEAMIDSVILYAKNDQALAETPKKVNIGSLLDNRIYAFEAMGHHVQFNNHFNKPVILTIRTVALQRAINNLINNALKYGTNVEVHCYPSHHNEVAINVIDDGPGVPENELASMILPFYKASNSIGGSGLGLTITHEIVAHHHGKLHIKNRPEGGLGVTIVLPKS